jgi:hypothetical protein
MSFELTVQITIATSRLQESIQQTPRMNAAVLGWGDRISINGEAERFCSSAV